MKLNQNNLNSKVQAPVKTEKGFKMSGCKGVEEAGDEIERNKQAHIKAVSSPPPPSPSFPLSLLQQH